MRIFVLVLLLAMVAGCNKDKPAQQTAAVANVQTVVLKVEGMDCAACPITVRKALEKVPGVVSASVNYEDKTAMVRFDPSKTRVSVLTQATGNAGYKSSVIKGEKK